MLGGSVVLQLWEIHFAVGYNSWREKRSLRIALGVCIENQQPSNVLEFREIERLSAVVGELNKNIHPIKQNLDVDVQARGTTVIFTGNDDSVALAKNVVESLYKMAGAGLYINPSLVSHACRLLKNNPDASIYETFSDVVYTNRKGHSIFPRSENQREYIASIRKCDVVFGVGPAGTGKTYLAMAMAIAALMKGDVDRIILCRPAVEAGERLGYLPGNMVEKVDPYLRPLYDAMNDMVEPGRVERMIERGIIEVAPLAFMRGRTLANAFVLLDEAQNTTSAQMKMFLTRIGVGSRAVITGDTSQIDLPYNATSGLVEAIEVLRSIDKIGFVEFQTTDVVRHGLVSAIIEAYERAGVLNKERTRGGRR